MAKPRKKSRGDKKAFLKLFKAAEKARKAGQHEVSAEKYGQALSIKPDHPPSLRGLGNTYFDMGRIADAERVLIQAVRADDKSADGFLALGMVLQEAGKKEASAQAYDRMLQLKPNHKHAREVRTVLQRLR